MKISVVIPAYNEEKTIEKVIKSCSDFSEIIVVDDASIDSTPKLLKGVKVIHNKTNLGHAKSLLKGLREAKEEYVFYMDADDQIKVSNLKYDMLCGYRIGRKEKLYRRIVSFILKIVIFIRHGMYIRDANCPFKVFRKEMLQFLMFHLPNNSVVPSISLRILAQRYGYRVIDIPVRYHPTEPRKGVIHSINRKSLKLFWEAFWEVVRL